MTDQELYQGLQNKDYAAFRYMYRHMSDRIRGMIQQYNGTSEDLDDVMQESLVILWMNIKKEKYQLSERAKLSTYFYSICRNVMAGKSRKRSKMKMSAISDSHHEIADTLETVDLPEEELLLESCLEELNENCRRILHMFYYEHKSLHDIAKALNFTDQTAKNNKYRCMNKIRELFLQKLAKI